MDTQALLYVDPQINDEYYSWDASRYIFQSQRSGRTIRPHSVEAQRLRPIQTQPALYVSKQGRISDEEADTSTTESSFNRDRYRTMPHPSRTTTTIIRRPRILANALKTMMVRSPYNAHPPHLGAAVHFQVTEIYDLHL